MISGCRARARIPLTEDDVDDLCWLLQRDYEGDLGVRSNWEPAVREAMLRAHLRRDSASWHEIPIASHTAQRAPAVDEWVVEAAQRLRVLDARWRLLAPRHRAVLGILFERVHRNPIGWGELWPIVLRLPASAQAHAMARSAKSLPGWLEHIRSRPAKWARVVERLEAEAQDLVDDACDAWRATRRRLREARRATT